MQRAEASLQRLDLEAEIAIVRLEQALEVGRLLRVALPYALQFGAEDGGAAHLEHAAGDRAELRARARDGLGAHRLRLNLEQPAQCCGAGGARGEHGRKGGLRGLGVVGGARRERAEQQGQQGEGNVRRLLRRDHLLVGVVVRRAGQQLERPRGHAASRQGVGEAPEEGVFGSWAESGAEGGAGIA